MLRNTTPAARTYGFILLSTVLALILVIGISLYAVLLYQERATFSLAVLTGFGAFVLAFANQISIVMLGKGQAGTEDKLDNYNHLVSGKVEDTRTALEINNSKTDNTNDVVNLINAAVSGSQQQVEEIYRQLRTIEEKIDQLGDENAS